MKKFIGVIIVLIIVVALFIVFNGGENRICSEDRCFQVELAQSPEERAQGLMFKKEVGEDKGMLFIYEEEGIYKFWMKNTLIPLDIIWLNSEGEVIFISNNTQPCEEDLCPTYGTNLNSKYVLEINAGKAAESNIVVGSKLDILLI